MVFMLIVESVALIQLTVKSISEGSYVLALVSVALFILSVLFLLQSRAFIFSSNSEKSSAVISKI
jgi:hypothetical protein